MGSNPELGTVNTRLSCSLNFIVRATISTRTSRSLAPPILNLDTGSGEVVKLSPLPVRD